MARVVVLGLLLCVLAVAQKDTDVKTNKELIDNVKDLGSNTTALVNDIRRQDIGGIVSKFFSVISLYKNLQKDVYKKFIRPHDNNGSLTRAKECVVNSTIVLWNVQRLKWNALHLRPAKVALNVGLIRMAFPKIGKACNAFRESIGLRIPGANKAKCIFDSNRYEEINKKVGEALNASRTQEVLKLVPDYLKSIKEAFASCNEVEAQQKQTALYEENSQEESDCEGLRTQLGDALIDLADSVKRREANEVQDRKRRFYKEIADRYNSYGCNRF
eukprot:TRINITY_DN538_c0_g2_i4.p1 TRINITY_DN538_c0_g2~~TRINITY_DN538_c0_g2_i4.p1  ORF type:complete len:273 (-),score=56.65 TRINITY_DN538_c0_g2_i4:110-928(-)